MKRSQISLAIRETQMKATIQLLAKIKRNDHTKCTQECGKAGTL